MVNAVAEIIYKKMRTKIKKELFSYRLILIVNKNKEKNELRIIVCVA